MPISRHRKRRWGRNLGYGCLTLVVGAILLIFAANSVMKHRLNEVRASLGPPRYLGQLAEQTTPVEQFQANSAMQGAPLELGGRLQFQSTPRRSIE